MRRALVAGGALSVGGLALVGASGPAGSAPSPAQDARILDFLLGLEHLQDAFYAEASRSGGLSGELLAFAQVVAGHERAHVAHLSRLVGGGASEPAATAFGDAPSDPDEFLAAAVILEDAGVAAYNGQAANLTPAGRAAAARVVSVDARHAAWIRAIAGLPPAREPLDAGKSAAEIRATIGRTGFVGEP